MKHTLCTFALLLALAPTVQAQEHQHADSSRAMPMHHDGMMDPGGMMDMEKMHAMMPQMMRMHERMMADSAMHRMMMADPEMRRMMHEMMEGDPLMSDDHDMAAMRERMAAMSPDERRRKIEQMHARMMERMQAMEPDERRAMMQRMMRMHQKMHEKMMANPAMHERMMADPEMREMMEGMMERMREGGMMEHGGMDHGQMNGMDHGRRGEMPHDQMKPAPMSADAARAAEAASRTADRFHTALAAGDRAAVEVLLLPDAVVLEEGKSESRTEYFGHHFGSDAAFLAAVEREPLVRETEVAGDVAWVASTRRLHGTYDGRQLDLDSAELLVLRRDASAPDGWRVAAVHWSSRSRK